MTSVAMGDATSVHVGAGRHRQSSSSALRWVTRGLSGSVLVGLAVLLALNELAWREWEAWIAGHVTTWFTSLPTAINQNAFYVAVGTPDVFGLRVTTECTSAIVVVGLLGITAVLTMATRVPLHRLALAAGLSTLVFFLFNQVRLIVIALATRQWGFDGGFYWSHIWAGTFITVFGAAGIFVLYLITIGAVGRGRRKTRPRNERTTP